MTDLSLAVLIIILIAAAFVALLIGYALGSRFGGGRKSVAARNVQAEHDRYKNDVREHFEQTSAIMSRMVDDYRDMYRHMAEGAEKLGDIHPEKRVTPPPAPEAITQNHAEAGDEQHARSSDHKPEQASPETTAKTHESSEQHTAQNSDSSPDERARQSDPAADKERKSKQYGLE